MLKPLSPGLQGSFQIRFLQTSLHGWLETSSCYSSYEIDVDFRRAANSEMDLFWLSVNFV